VACRKKGDAESFLRVAAAGAGELEFFDRRSSGGRSAYICPDEACIEKAMQKDRLSRALKKPVAEAAKDRLKQELLCRLR
jgi:predicted RNA-binding protein YlxR (DUF448 family)